MSRNPLNRLLIDRDKRLVPDARWVDPAPALPSGRRGEFFTPGRSTGEWIETSPGCLTRALNAAQDPHSNVRPAIRPLKGWRRARKKAMRSLAYAVEVPVLDAASRAPRHRTGLGRAVLGPIAGGGRARARLPLPGPQDNRPITVRARWTDVSVAAGLTADHRARLVEIAGRALEGLEEAEVVSARGRVEVATRMLEAVFFGNQPEDR